jgi:hypothetical protein
VKSSVRASGKGTRRRNAGWFKPGHKRWKRKPATATPVVRRPPQDPRPGAMRVLELLESDAPEDMKEGLRLYLRDDFRAPADLEGVLKLAFGVVAHRIKDRMGMNVLDFMRDARLAERRRKIGSLDTPRSRAASPSAPTPGASRTPRLADLPDHLRGVLFRMGGEDDFRAGRLTISDLESMHERSMSQMDQLDQVIDATPGGARRRAINRTWMSEYHEQNNFPEE